MILLTGASGFLGQRLMWLARNQGRSVRALVRKPMIDPLPLANPTLLPNPGHNWVVCHGDITHAATLPAALEGVEAVIHAAATTSESAPDEAASRRTNVEGTRNLLAACHKAVVERWIQIS